jgi:nucleoside-diphosphate-sugar epimerase
VDDCVDGLVGAAERYDGPEPVNLGTGVETSIRETAELVAEAVGFDGRITWDTSMPNGQPRRSLDASRARELFGWEATTPLREGIARTVAWYRTSVPV